MSGKIRNEANERFLCRSFGKNLKIWIFPGLIQRCSRVPQRQFWSDFGAPKPLLTALSETPFFFNRAVSWRLGACFGLTGPPLSGRLLLFTSSTWCEALFLHFAVLQKSGVGEIRRPDPMYKTHLRDSFWSTFLGFHRVWTARGPCKHTKN